MMNSDLFFSSKREKNIIFMSQFWLWIEPQKCVRMQDCVSNVQNPRDLLESVQLRCKPWTASYNMQWWSLGQCFHLEIKCQYHDLTCLLLQVKLFWKRLIIIKLAFINRYQKRIKHGKGMLSTPNLFSYSFDFNTHNFNGFV